MIVKIYICFHKYFMVSTVSILLSLQLCVFTSMIVHWIENFLLIVIMTTFGRRLAFKSHADWRLSLPGSDAPVPLLRSAPAPIPESVDTADTVLERVSMAAC